ncbi:acyl-CoA thioesterase, partial [Streptomyces prasinopilosus]|uniref:acyl-CoA thioesterase n=1 Tax=Streptomyces prasinopilosus TaxID=67344 RepID=UPI000A6E5311
RRAPVDIELWVEQIRAASFTLAYEVKDGDQVYVRASTVIVPFDFEAQRPRRLTQEEREFLREYTDDGDNEGDAADDADQEEAVAA